MELFENVNLYAFAWCRFESVYLDESIRVAKDIRGDYLVVDRAPYDWQPPAA